MKKRMITIVACLIGFALAGIIIVQFLWIRHALKVSGEQFDQSVNEALNNVVVKLEKQENVMMVTEKLAPLTDTVVPLTAPCVAPAFTIRAKEAAIPQHEHNAVPPVAKTGNQRYPHSGSVVLPNNDTLVVNGSFNFDGISENFGNNPVESFEYIFHNADPSKPRKHAINQSISIKMDTLGMVLQKLTSLFMVSTSDTNITDEDFWKGLSVHAAEPGDFSKAHPAVRSIYKNRIRQQARKVNEAIRQVAIDMTTINKPLQDRIDSVNLKKELNKAFIDRGINLPFQYGITVGYRDSLTPIKSSGFLKVAKPVTYRVSLFPAELIGMPDYLNVFFPDRNRHIFSSVSLMLIASAIFTLIIILAFITSIVIMLRQKKLSDIKNDFINNMTHEFKTPLATISLAVDSINNAKVIHDPDKVKSFTRVIREENTRMNKHVEQVLQMALMDRKEMKLEVAEVDMHMLIGRAIDQMRIQVESRSGAVQMVPGASLFIVRGDEMHLFNVIINLLDNANKYSPVFPDIRVTTVNTNTDICISVEDHGIGMSREAQKHIFEKFYRVPTGNIHNVKGIGLGLSYVKAIAEAHRGTVQVKSEPGRGTTIMLSLPLFLRPEL